MKSFKLYFSLAFFSLLFAASAQAVYIPRIHGNVIYANSYDEYAAGATVQICLNPNRTNCVTLYTDMNGYYSIQNWNVDDNATLYFFVWADEPHPEYRTGRWGTTAVYINYSKACQQRDQWGYCKNYGLSYSPVIHPSPLPPQAINPAPNSWNVGRTQTFKWTSGKDSWRTYYNVVYDIYGSGWEAPLLLQASNIPCNPDANGYCQWVCPVQLEPQTYYNWKVVAKTVTGAGYFPTSSPVFHFTTGY